MGKGQKLVTPAQQFGRCSNTLCGKGEICLFISLACGFLCVGGGGCVCEREAVLLPNELLSPQFILISKVTVFIIRAMPLPQEQ